MDFCVSASRQSQHEPFALDLSRSGVMQTVVEEGRGAEGAEERLEKGQQAKQKGAPTSTPW